MIRVRNLRFTYERSDRPAVRDLCFEIEKGEIFGFLGPNGAGKSTTQKILIKLLGGYSGDVSVLGRDLRSWNTDYYERIGVSFELPTHYLKLTAKENLSYFAAMYAGATRSPEELLELVDLERDADMLVSRYSKGMKVRLGVARSLINHPELIFMDEPTAGLDPISARRVKEIIRAQKEAGRTVFLTTHDMTVADDLCDRVAFIVDGAIKLIDAPRELKLRHGQDKVRVEYVEQGVRYTRDFPFGGLGDDGEFLSLLRAKEVQTLHSQEATLEEIFIEVTGRHLS